MRARAEKRKRPEKTKNVDDNNNDNNRAGGGLAGR
jgi:hypothetical protein